jgi:hypothetical protein
MVIRLASLTPTPGVGATPNNPEETLMTRWTIDGRGDTGTKARHSAQGKILEYNVQRLPSGFWLAEVEYPDGSKLLIDASERSEAGSHARCEYHAANIATQLTL